LKRSLITAAAGRRTGVKGFALPGSIHIHHGARLPHADSRDGAKLVGNRRRVLRILRRGAGALLAPRIVQRIDSARCRAARCVAEPYARKKWRSGRPD